MRKNCMIYTKSVICAFEFVLTESLPMSTNNTGISLELLDESQDTKILNVHMSLKICLRQEDVHSE